MITKLRKAQDSWATKALLTITALSFVSLFGISGYIDTATTNPAVIKVNDQTVTKQEFDFQINQQAQIARSIFGDDFEITDEVYKLIAADVVAKDLSNLITKETAQQQKVYISDELVKKIIFSQVQFLNQDGSFNRARFDAFLRDSGLNEALYIQAIKNDLQKQFLIQNPSSQMNVPSVLTQYAYAIQGQRKVFQYITVNEKDIKIDREISAEEVEQFYQDFSSAFTLPENRDVSFIIVSNEDIAKNIEISSAQIEEYYNANIQDFVEPQTRDVLQILFDDEDTATKAAAKIASGSNFYGVATEYANQQKEDTELGYISKDMLINELSDAVFAANKNDVVGPIKSSFGWHIMKVVSIKDEAKIDLSQAKKSIEDTIKSEIVYDEAYNQVANIEDMIGQGSSLEDIAQNMEVKIYTAKQVQENGDVASFPKQHKLLQYSNDFIDAVFSYNQNEISQMIEDDAGFVFVRIDNIKEATVQSIENVLPEIEKIWEENERAAIAQETINNVVFDLENGDKIKDVAKRYGLGYTTTKPLDRSQVFAELSPVEINMLFNEDMTEVNVLEKENAKIIVQTASLADSKELSNEEKEMINAQLRLDIDTQAKDQLINAYGKDYDVRVKLRQIGLAD